VRLGSISNYNTKLKSTYWEFGERFYTRTHLLKSSCRGAAPKRRRLNLAAIHPFLSQFPLQKLANMCEVGGAASFIFFVFLSHFFFFFAAAADFRECKRDKAHTHTTSARAVSLALPSSSSSRPLMPTFAI